MRKGTVKFVADKLFWLLVALLPLIIFALQFLIYELPSVTTEMPSFLEFMQNFGISSDSICYTVMSDLFGAEGILPFFSAGNNAVLLFLAYFCSVEIIHLAVDFIVFIPRLSHKFMNKFCHED